MEPDVFSRLGSKYLPHREQRLDPKSRRYANIRLTSRDLEKRRKEMPRTSYKADRANRRAPTLTSEATISESEDNEGGHWKSKSKKQKYRTYEDDLSHPWLCEETDPFTLRIRNFVFPKRVHMSGNVKMYDGPGDPKDHLKNLQTDAKVER
ncbi:hypothetical protein Tco_1256327 [Tanacetum coccineum]